MRKMATISATNAPKDETAVINTYLYPIPLRYINVCVHYIKTAFVKHITPKLIIIDNSLSDFYRNRLIKEAHKKVIKVHDIKRQGACILDLERQK